MAHHVLANAGLANADARLEQFAVVARGAPQLVLAAHLADQLPGFFGHGRPDFPCRISHVQKRRKPLRRQAMTVSGLTMTRSERQSKGLTEDTQAPRSHAVRDVR